MSSMKRQRTPFWNVFRRSLTVLVGETLLCFIADASFAQSPGPSKLEDSLKSFLQHYTGTSAEGKATRYSAAFTDLRGDGIQEALVYLTSDGWCGSGGCTMLVLAPRGSSYTLVTKNDDHPAPHTSLGNEIEWLVRLGCASTRWWDSLRLRSGTLV